MRAWATLAFSLLGIAGCFSESDGDGPASSAATEVGSGDATATGDSTAAPGSCAGTCAMVADGWSGPVVVADLDAAQVLPGCQGAYALEVFSLGTTPAPPTGTCACDCGEATSIACGNAVLRQHAFGDDACTRTRVEQIELQEGCNDAPFSLAPASYSFLPAPAEVTCGVTTMPQLDPPSFEGQLRACGASELAPCGDGVCAPAPAADFMRACIYQQGDVACPSEGDFGDRLVAYATLEDGRDCPAAACDCATEADDCVTDVALTNNCQDSPNSFPLGACSTSDAPAGQTNVVTVPPQEAICTAATSRVPPTGDVTPAGAVTFCCLADG